MITYRDDAYATGMFPLVDVQVATREDVRLNHMLARLPKDTEEAAEWCACVLSQDTHISGDFTVLSETGVFPGCTRRVRVMCAGRLVARVTAQDDTYVMFHFFDVSPSPRSRVAEANLRAKVRATAGSR